MTTFQTASDADKAGGLGKTKAVAARREREQEALRQSELVYRTLVETSPDAIVLVAPDGTILLANGMAVAAHGFSVVDELVGRNLFELVAHEEHQRAMKHLSTAVEIGSIRNIEHQLLRVDGSRFPAELSVSVIVAEDGQPKAFIAIVRDITERKESRQRIERLLGEVQSANEDLARAYDTTLEGWCGALDLRDKETEGHSQRVTKLPVQLALVMGMDEDEMVSVRRGALLHDIGKMGIPDSILLKPGPLTDEEWEIMRMHPVYANDLLSPIAFLRPALSIAYCHHERWNGSGYPRGLRGEEIPLAARIFAVVDVYDALRSDRPYRKAWTEQRVREFIRAQVGTHFDPAVVKAFLETDIPAMHNLYSDVPVLPHARMLGLIERSQARESTETANTDAALST